MKLNLDYTEFDQISIPDYRRLMGKLLAMIYLRSEDIKRGMFTEPVTVAEICDAIGLTNPDTVLLMATDTAPFGFNARIIAKTGQNHQHYRIEWAGVIEPKTPRQTYNAGWHPAVEPLEDEYRPVTPALLED